MCCFSMARAPSRLFGLLRARPQLEVSGTRIFARVEPAGARGETGVQWLAYSMTLAVSSDVAMVLPLPVARASEDALRFIDLSSYAELFDRLDDYFPSIESLEQAAPKSRGLTLSLPTLTVHRVGSFDASFVPSLADMSRLDARFRIPDEVWHQRDDYAGYGFAVFKLRKGAAKRIHPMAMQFDTREPGSIFFPTVHVHDGHMHDVAHFDHALTYQGHSERVIGPGGTSLAARSATLAVSPALVDGARGLIAAEVPLRRVEIEGDHPNTDVRVPLT